MNENQKLNTEPYKGVRDFYPEDMAVQNYIFDTWRKVTEDFNYEEYSASILEYADLYRSKGSDEIVNDQMYTFRDKGDREVALRPEMTPSLARMIAARRKGLKLPLRWFSIPNVFRYERPQRGRKREHWQLNCDIMGVAGIDAEVEMITMAYKIMKEFGAKDEDFEIRINSRKLLNKIFQRLDLTKEEGYKLTRLLDKSFDKSDPEAFSNFDRKLIEIFGEEKASIIKKQFGKDPKEKIDPEIYSEETRVFTELTNKLKEKGVNEKVLVFTQTLTRGFDYYTGIVFEVFDTHEDNRRSLFGGGRYDNLLEMFGVEPLPTVGFGMGDVTIRDFLETHKLPPFDK